MKKYLWLVFFLFCFAVQFAIEQTVFFKFDLPLLAVYAIATIKGQNIGGVAGIGVGLVQDLLTSGIFGFHIFTRSLVGYISGYVKEQVFREHFIYHMVAAAIFTVAVRTIFFFLQGYLARAFGWDFMLLYLEESLAYCLGNIVLVIPVYRLCLFLDKRINN